MDISNIISFYCVRVIKNILMGGGGTFVEFINRIRLNGVWPAGKLTANPFTRREPCLKNAASKGCGGRAARQNRLDAKLSRV